MQWLSLYNARRVGDPIDKEQNPDRVRNSFVRDYDRIIFSSAFRRLQNKTQVFPLPGSVFVHNRLTHSLEVASVGRSLGKFVGDMVAAKYKDAGEGFNEFYTYALPSVIAAACLAHDIGNPPFGHSGEEAIRTYFKELEGETRQIIHDNLSENQRLDMELFEGNANAFRTLTHSFNETEPGGYKLTYATLASIVKYPCSSIEGFDDTKGIATKKSGFFDSEINIYANLAETLDIPRVAGSQNVYARHPFVYLTEGADDICYRIIDMEDAHRLHIVTFDKIKELFLPFFDENPNAYNSRSYIETRMEAIKDENKKVSYLRANWIGLMIEKLGRAFMANEEKLLNGTLDKDLMKCLPENDVQLIKAINKFSVDYIYNYKSVVEIEIAGYNVIGGLLREFVSAVLHPERTRSVKLIKLVSNQFPITRDKNKIYHDVQSVVDYISGMTDVYAIDLYRKITGITIPDLR